MPAYAVLYAVENSVIEADAPSAVKIEAALRGAPGALPEATRWQWVGGAPRIVRQAIVGTGFRTHVAWPAAWTDAQVALADLGPLRDALARAGGAALASIDAGPLGVRTEWTATVADYGEAANGPLAFWTSGAAANTRTRDNFPTGTARLDPNENPLGPDTNVSTSPTGIVRGVTGFTSSLGPLLIAGGALALVVYAWPWLAAARRSAAPRRR